MSIRGQCRVKSCRERQKDTIRMVEDLQYHGRRYVWSGSDPCNWNCNCCWVHTYLSCSVVFNHRYVAGCARALGQELDDPGRGGEVMPNSCIYE